MVCDGLAAMMSERAAKIHTRLPSFAVCALALWIAGCATQPGQPTPHNPHASEPCDSLACPDTTATGR